MIVFIYRPCDVLHNLDQGLEDGVRDTLHLQLTVAGYEQLQVTGWLQDGLQSAGDMSAYASHFVDIVFQVK